MTGRARLAVLGVVGVLSLVAATAAVPTLADPQRQLTVTFDRTVGLYEGADVKVLGIEVGSVESIRVVGTAVEVEIAYDADVELPADVTALVVAPSIVGDRFVQLAPAYVEGPTLPDDARIDESRTAVPVELDETYATVQELAVALGPEGANADGALSRLISAAAGVLDGNGRRLNQTVEDLSSAMAVLADSSGDIDSTVGNLARITETLAGNDDRVRDVVTLLASVGLEIARQRTDLVGAVRSLRTALTEVDRFTRTHRDELVGTVRRARRVTGTLSRHTEKLVRLVDLFPVGLTSLMRLYVPTNWDPQRPGDSVVDGRTGSGALRDNFLDSLDTQLGALLLAICDQLAPGDAADLEPFCTTLGDLGGSLGALLQQLTGRGALGAPGGAG